MSDVSQESHMDMEKQNVVHLEGVTAQPTADDPNYQTKISLAEKKLIRKIDLKILPYLCAVGFFQFLDKMTLSYASVLGIIEDTNLVGSDYGALGSIFYVGYLAMQVNAMSMTFVHCKCSPVFSYSSLI
jgi:MFS family permease